MSQAIANHSPGPAASLPVPLTSLIGREEEVESLSRLVRREEVRLVSLTGPGGVGKTRLALRLAETIAPEYPDCVWFVSLGPIRDPELVASAIAQALGVRESGGRSVEAGIISFLRDRRALLVIDNFEHVLEAAPLLASIVSACPLLTCVVTSRVVLLLSAEHEFPVQPLESPALTEVTTLERPSSAARLFVARARAVQPAFSLTNDNASDVAAICRYVDGLPLAIELAASRIRHFSPSLLLNRIAAGSPLEVLTGGPRDVPTRQRTLRDTIAWSYDLLPPEEQAFFQRMSVFTGGFTLEAAEWMLGDAGETGAPSSPLDLIASLVDKSLVERREAIDGETPSSGGRWRNAPEGEIRFAMLETIREYGLELLAASGEDAATRDAHAAFMLAFAERAEDQQFGPEQRRWLNNLEAEHANINGAMAWFDRREATLDLERLVKALFFFWWYQGHMAEGRAWLERAVTRGADRSSPERSWVAIFAGVMALNFGDYDRAIELSRVAEAEAEATGDLAASAMAATSAGCALLVKGDSAEAIRYGALAVARAREADDPVWLANVLGDVGMIAGETGNHAQAVAFFEEALAIDRALGDRYLSAVRLSDLGMVAHKDNDEVTAARCYAESVDLFWEIGSVWYLTSPLFGLGAIATPAEPVAAAHLIGAAEALRERGSPTGWPHERDRDAQTQARLRATLGDEKFAREKTIGRSMPLSDVVAIARRVSAGNSQPAEAQDQTAEALSARELEVLRLLVSGHSDKEIAEALEISSRTASKHVGNILSKLGVSTRAEAAVHALRAGIVE